MSKSRVVYTHAEDIKKLAADIVETLKDHFWYIDLSRVYFIRSRNSRTRAIARIHGLPRIWVYVMNIKPMYIVEVVSENFDSLSFKEKIYVIVHELLHIPKSFGGGLRPHKSFVSNIKVEKLVKIYLDRKTSTASNSGALDLDE
ncbi:MAG: putative metallopeptidase [Ignisphaera sp.]|uniref:Metallopeptidase n=1 Tax=Ignisphaera aggregans TaxID=334771 RepID=A0A7J3N0T4_9CREN